MSEFFRETRVRAAKEHRCESCGTAITKGTPHQYLAMKQEGCFYAFRSHIGCRAAECELAEFRGYYDGDEWPVLHSLEEQEDRDWLVENHPAVFARVANRYPDTKTGGAA